MVRSGDTWGTDASHGNETGSGSGVVRYNRALPKK